MSHYSGSIYQPGMVPVGGVPMGGVVGGVPMTPAYGTPLVDPIGNSLMMSGVGTPYGTPHHIDTYPSSIARMPSTIYSPSLYNGRRGSYDDYDYSAYDRDYLDRDYERGRRYYDDDDIYRYRSSSRASRRSRRDYDDYYNYDYDRGYYDDPYDRYRSSSRYYRNGQERIGDKMRRLVGMDPKGVNIVRLKRGESLATGVRR
ncbi:hypothetical protein FRC17_002194 [Serendipita sp. 399]|nr:hypothetical protein FRC17_002194 [Serendipita sp. 399]